jgi:hypothetical protein
MTKNRCATFAGLFAAAMATAFLAIGPAAADEREPINTGYFDNVAILGYDTVAYFTEGRPLRGKPEISHSWLGATWQFASTANRDAFAANPISYAPQYGGFCAGSVAAGNVTDNIDPEAFRIIDGKLYLFGGKAGIEQDFDPAAPKILADGEAHWPEVKERIRGN